MHQFCEKEPGLLKALSLDLIRFLRLAPAVAALASTAALAADDGKVMETTVQVRDGVVKIDACAYTRSSPLDAWQLLADYESLPSYMPNMDTSRVVTRTDSSVLVRQVISSWLVLPWTFRVNLEFFETAPALLRFRQHDGRGGYEGQWSVESAASGAKISYDAEAEPDMLLPDFVMAHVVRRQIGRMMQAFIDELDRRG